MPELYIGNVSKQIQVFCYRFPERPGFIQQLIPIGGQIRVSPNGSLVDLSTMEIDYVLNQHKTYGLVNVNDIDGKQSPFSGLCYSIGKPMTPEKLRRAMFKKEETLNSFGQKLRQEAALAVNSQLENQVGPQYRGQLEMSFEEIEPRGGYTDDTSHLSEGVFVTKDAQPGAPTPIEMIGRRRR